MESINYNFGFRQAINEDERRATFIASDSSRDAHGTVVNQDGWSLERYNKNPIVGYQHDVYGSDFCVKASPDDVIGKGHAYVEHTRNEEDKVLMLDIIFDGTHKEGTGNEVAEKVFQKVKKGFLNAVSVGFLELGKGKTVEEKDGDGNASKTYFFEGQELLEVSVVNIPSNSNAVATSRNFQGSLLKAVTYLSKMFGIPVNDVYQLTIEDIAKSMKEGRVVKNTTVITDPQTLNGSDNELTQVYKTINEFLGIKQ